MDKQYNSWCEWFADTQMPKAPEEEETKEVKPDAKRKTQRKQGQKPKEAKD